MTNPIHPGEHVAEFIEEYAISQSELAKRMGIPRMRVSQIVRGQRILTADTAIRLGIVFGTTPQFWMNLQARYDIELAKPKIDPRSIAPLVA